MESTLLLSADILIGMNIPGTFWLGRLDAEEKMVHNTAKVVHALCRQSSIEETAECSVISDGIDGVLNVPLMKGPESPYSGGLKSIHLWQMASFVDDNDMWHFPFRVQTISRIAARIMGKDWLKLRVEDIVCSFFP